MASKDEKKDPKEIVPPTPPKSEELTQVPTSLLEALQKQLSDLQIQVENGNAKTAGLEELLQNKPSEEGGNKLREKKNFEPKFRTVRIRQYPIMGDHANLGYVIGWTNRGAYQEVDRTGVTPQYVDFIDVIFLGQERNEEGKLKAEKIKLIDLFTKGVQVACKIQKIERHENKIPTGEEIDVTVYDPLHGMMGTGEVIDGYVIHSDIVYTIEIPGRAESVEIDGTYVN